jgi:undecaprenyl-diphosphatase
MRRQRWPYVLLLIATVVAAAGFAAFASEVAERELRPLDEAGRSVVVHLQSRTADIIFGAITWLGAAAVLIPVSLCTAWYLWRRRSGARAAPIVLAPIGAVILADTLKAIFRSERPTGGVAAMLGYSFPSGHTTGVTATALTIAYVLVREEVLPPAAAVGSIALPLLVGVSRMYLDVHWASDVLGGWVVGLVVAGACAALYERTRQVDSG